MTATAAHPLYTGGRREYLVAYGLTTISGPIAFAALIALTAAISAPTPSDAPAGVSLALFAAAVGTLVLGRFLRRRAWQWVAGNVHLAEPAWMRRLALTIDLASIVALPVAIHAVGADAGPRLVLGAAVFVGTGFVASRRITGMVPWIARIVASAIAGAFLMPFAEMTVSDSFWFPVSMVTTGALVALMFRLLRGRVAPYLG